MKRSKLVDLAIFAMLGTILFISKIIFEFLPNVHPIAMFIAVYTLVYRARALIPIYLSGISVPLASLVFLEVL